MSVTNFIPTLWSARILKAIAKLLVYANVVNRDYEGEVRALGDKVKILEVGDVSITNYTRDGELTYETLADASKLLEITQAKNFAFRLDDADGAQAVPGLIDEAARKAGLGLLDVIDQYIAAFYSSAGITDDLGDDSTPLEIQSGNVISTLALIARKLDDEDVPEDGRFIVVPPWVIEDLRLAKAVWENPNTAILSTGYVGRFMNLEVFKSTNVPNTTGTKYKILAGTRAAISLALQLNKVEAIRLEKYFADGVRGLALYGGKVVQPDCLACATFNEAEESEVI